MIAFRRIDNLRMNFSSYRNARNLPLYQQISHNVYRTVVDLIDWQRAMLPIRKLSYLAWFRIRKNQ